MSISNYELSVLIFIDKNTVKKTLNNSVLIEKYGESVSYTLETLMNEKYIECPLISATGGDSFMPFIGSYESMNNWSVTAKGKCYIENHKLETKLSLKTQVINYFLGFVSGLLSGCGVQLFVHYCINK